MSVDRVRSLDLIVADLAVASDFIEKVAPYSIKDRVDGFSRFSFADFDVMLSESALVDVGTSSGVIIHIEVEDLDSQVRQIAEQHSIAPSYGPEHTEWGTYSAIFHSPEAGFAIDLYSEPPAPSRWPHLPNIRRMVFGWAGFR